MERVGLARAGGALLSERWRRRAWAGGLLVGLLVASWLFLTPAPAEAPSPFPFADKVAHFLVFAGLAFLARRAYPEHPAWGVLVALTLYGVAIEFAQREVPGRAPDVLDALADVAGAAAFLLAERAGRTKK